jgi:NADPH:quinone reductase-like Zn-dependent oxidoreductase
LEPFTVGTPFGPDLAFLVELLAAGEIDPQVGLRTSWKDVAEAAEALRGRRVVGKAVLDVD